MCPEACRLGWGRGRGPGPVTAPQGRPDLQAVSVCCLLSLCKASGVSEDNWYLFPGRREIAFVPPRPGKVALIQSDYWPLSPIYSAVIASPRA